MGSVNFNTDVDKTVDITKNVFLDVNKDVFSFVDIEGNLATAEASADAIGGGGGDIVVDQQKVLFIPDDNVSPFGGGTAPQEIAANANPASINPNPDSDIITVPASDTPFTSQVDRTLFTEVQSTDGTADLLVNLAAPNKIAFDQGVTSYANAFVNWDIDGGEDPFPLDDNAGILDDFNTKVTQFVVDNGIDTTTAAGRAAVRDFIESDEGPCYTFTVTDINWDPGQTADPDGPDGPLTGEPATVRVSFWVEDTDGNIAVVSNLFVPGADGTGFDGLSVTGTFAGLIDEDLANGGSGDFIAGNAADGGIVLIGVEDDVDGNGDPVNLDNLARFQVLLEDDPTEIVGLDPSNPGTENNPFSTDGIVDSDDGDPTTSEIDWTIGGVYAAEAPSRNGTDADASLFWTTCEEIVIPGGEGNLAETDTFAQVSPEGAFSFSESLAASNSTDFFDIA